MIEALFDNNLARTAAWARADADWLQRGESGPAPEILWIGCSDSRLAAHEIVGLEPGDLLVHNNVANLAPNGDLNLMAVLHFAVEALKVRHIIVCGHTGCAGVQLAFGNARNGALDRWLASVRRLGEDQAKALQTMRDPETRANFVAELNVVDQVRSLAENVLVRGAWGRGQALQLHGWMYAMRDGLLRNLDVSVASRADAERLWAPAPGSERGGASGRRP